MEEVATILSDLEAALRGPQALVIPIRQLQRFFPVSGDNDRIVISEQLHHDIDMQPLVIDDQYSGFVTHLNSTLVGYGAGLHAHLTKSL